MSSEDRAFWRDHDRQQARIAADERYGDAEQAWRDELGDLDFARLEDPDRFVVETEVSR